MYLDGRGIRHRDERGRPLVDDSYLVQLHAGPEPVTVELPGPPWADGYELVVSTEYPTGAPPATTDGRPRGRSSSPAAASGCSGCSAGRDALASCARMDLNHLNLRVRDAAACRDFYQRHFGFRPAFEADGGYFVRNDDGFLLALVPAGGAPAAPRRRSTSDSGYPTRTRVADLHDAT